MPDGISKDAGDATIVVVDSSSDAARAGSRAVRAGVKHILFTPIEKLTRVLDAECVTAVLVTELVSPSQLREIMDRVGERLPGVPVLRITTTDGVLSSMRATELRQQLPGRGS